ncbi:FecR domain-containing protein [Mesorhizobium sp. SB112]|uniref:FecR family protein n=1 Tax=Mesorhizobium sp. SB112 TaxID=3151853 RepID=UPI003267D483
MRPADQPPHDRSEAELREEARQWFVSLLERPTAARRAEFETWLRADPAHFEAYSAVEAAWQQAEQPGRRLAEKEAGQLAVYLEAMDQAKGRKKSFRRLSTLSVLLAAILAGGIWLERPNILQNMLADHSSVRGERRSIELSDGSSVLLDADSALDEDYTAAERRVRLLRGGAFFDVASSNVPFIVRAGSGEVRVLGTAFAVRLTDDGGLVTLERGGVEVTADERPEASALAPGQQVRFGTAGIGTVEEVSLDDELAWREGRFVFYRARLADVVREIQRYRRGRIVIATARLAGERVTGSVSLADTDAALTSIQASLGFRMNTLAGRLTVIGP